MQEHRASFAFETTLSGRGHAKRIRSLIGDGYSVHLLYIWLPNADQAVARVKLRVMHGGHDIPEQTIRRRYDRSLHNLTKLYMPIVSTWRVYDGRGSDQRGGVPLVAHGGLDSDVNVVNDMIWNELTRQFTGIHRKGPT